MSEEIEFENRELDDSTYSGREEAVREFIDQVPLLSPIDFQTNSKSLVTKVERRIGNGQFNVLAFEFIRELRQHLVKRSEKRDTGARGLQTELVAAVERAAFETFMQKKNARVVIDVKDGQLTSEIS